MDEYICKNSPREKPIAIRLFEFELEWQRGEKKIIIPYANIVSLNLNKVGSKYITRIDSDFQGTLVVTNRFYLSSGEFEDQSRQYNTFIRLLHLHLNKRATTTFLIGTPVKFLALILTVAAIFSTTLQWAMMNVFGSVHLTATIINAIIFLAIALRCAKSFPKAYSGNDIPLHFLPTIY